MKTFIIIFFAYLILSAIIAKIPAPKPKPKPKTITKTVVKVVEAKPIKPQRAADLDEIEYQRDRLQNLYTIADSIEKQLETAKKPERIETLTRKQIAVNAQIRKAQKIIQKELEK